MDTVTDSENSLQSQIELDRLYADFAKENLSPLWTQTNGLMPFTPSPVAEAMVWRWKALLPLAERAGQLVPVGRGGERRAIALANPGFGGLPYTTPTLWTAIQYLGAREEAPSHRHSQNAFRFIIEGEGVWTVVDGDPVAMRRGDFLLTAGWQFHSHYNTTDKAMAWLDGLDIPFQHHVDAGFFEYGTSENAERATPRTSRSERLWGHPGLRPVSVPSPLRNSPIAAYRFEHTDSALNEQLALEDEGYPGVLEPGHAAIRFSNPTTGGDVMPTIRAEFHRLRGGVTTGPRREVGSSVWQVFEGNGTILLGDKSIEVERGDVFVVPSWVSLTMTSDSSMDFFRFSDAPIFESLGLNRSENL